MSRGYGQYCPVSLGSEVVADRWTPLILREMVLGSTRFNDIERGLPGISRTLLAQRLRHLERTQVLERLPARAGRGSEYHLTPAGRGLEAVITAIGEWAVRWMFAEPEPEEVDPVTLTWWMHRRVNTDQLPDRRVVIQFNYRGANDTIIWLILDRGEPSVCVKHPGFDSDVIVTTDAAAFMRVFSGIDSLAEARRRGTVVLDGPRTLTRAFEQWFLWSPFAPAVREQLARH
ncbi:MAG TPA: helix-turn-helix domain-containing protein [Acidimicrobiales bacterium]|nr:helix-turn-helix domain-containing protein [Acidimicrobiales bacterium]